MKFSIVVILTLALLLTVAPVVLAAPNSPVPLPTVAATLEPTPVLTVTPEPTATPEPDPVPEPPDADTLTLAVLLTWLAAGGSGWVVSRILEDDLVAEWFKALSPKRKQAVAALGSGFLAMVAVLGWMALGEQLVPTSFEGWFNVLAPVFFGAPGMGELFHSRRKVTSGKSAS